MLGTLPLSDTISLEARRLPVRITACLAALLAAAPLCRADKPAPLLTVAEKTDYKATSRHADVVAYCAALAKLSPNVRLETCGTSVEGRKLPLLILADPPLSSPAEAVARKKTIILAIGDIHAGEVDGKEALLRLRRNRHRQRQGAAQGSRRAGGADPQPRRQRPDEQGPSPLAERSRRGRHPRQRSGTRPQPRLRQTGVSRGARLVRCSTAGIRPS